MTIPALPALDRTSPTFRTDVDTFFATTLPAFSAALGPEIERLSALGYGSYNASSTTSLTIGTGSKSLTIETGKGYVAGQAVLIASTAGPTNFMTGQVTSYNSGTGALVVNVTATGGSGTVAAWAVSVTALSSGGGVSPDSIVVLTSGTSWACPAGVTKVIGRVEGGSGGGGGGGATFPGGGGGGGGGALFIATVVPATSYTYAIGAAGTASPMANVGGGAGGSTTMTIGGVTYTGGGGSGGSGGTQAAGGASGSGSGTGAVSVNGTVGERGAVSYSYARGGNSAFGGSIGGDSYVGSGGSNGGAGRIILELYK